MFKRDVLKISDVIGMFIRQSGIETPLLQTRLKGAWGSVAGTFAERYTKGMYIRNQVLHVKITSPALRADLYMTRAQLVKRLNAAAGGNVITDIRFY